MQTGLGSLSPPCKDPEELAKRFLQAREFRAEHILTLLNFLPHEAPPRRGADAGSYSFSTGCYSQGTLSGLRRAVHLFPLVSEYLCKCVHAISPTHRFTTISIFTDLQAVMHTDSLNADVPNLIAPLSSFSGGELFVQHPEGSERQHFQGKELQGFLLDCSQRPWLFDAKRSQHCTLPWEGTRTVLVAFSVALSFKPQDAQVAASLGFNLPSEPARIPRPSSLDLRDLRHGGDDSVLAPAGSTPDAKRARAALDDAQAFALQHQFHLPPEGPLFLELCAGSAQLSACAARRGFMPVAVDCSENRHQPKYKTFNLDLGSPGSWSTLRHLVNSHLERVAHVHISPPCGTCSRMAEPNNGTAPSGSVGTTSDRPCDCSPGQGCLVVLSCAPLGLLVALLGAVCSV